MSKKHSPFAALTSREQQERWLEFQNTKLPYIEGDVDMAAAPDTAQWLGHYVEQSTAPFTPQTIQKPTAQDAQRRPYPQQGQLNTPVAASAMVSMQKTNHKQYDAVVRRMMEAEKQALKYQPSAT